MNNRSTAVRRRCNSSRCHANRPAVHQICHRHRHQLAFRVRKRFTVIPFIVRESRMQQTMRVYRIFSAGQPAGNAPDLSLSFGKGPNRHTSAPASPAKTRESLLQRVQSLTGAARDQGASIIGERSASHSNLIDFYALLARLNFVMKYAV